mmetsp:Transcript_35568/g.65899  ORF Transcript_35568/g.65899 Transcript_35568/m.65899 type:complete len:103 (-) Transcript_35568:277-585(-)
MQPTFRKCLKAVRSGCYFDFCFFAAVEYSKKAIAIIHASKCHHPYRGKGRESELVANMGVEWKDHWKDMESFDAAGVARKVYWWRNPEHFGEEKKKQPPPVA